MLSNIITQNMYFDKLTINAIQKYYPNAPQKKSTIQMKNDH